MKEKSLFFLYFIICTFTISSCSSFKLNNVSYGWNGEFFGTPEENGNFSIPRSSMQFNIMPILQEEKITSKPSEVKLRVIRDDEGYFYITADKFKNVWVFKTGESSLILKNKIELLGGSPLIDPKFNENKPYVKIFLKDKSEYIINKDGIIKMENK